jgi:hypothetical protein
MMGIIELDKSEQFLRLRPDEVFFIPGLSGVRLKISYSGGGTFRSQDSSDSISIDYTIEFGSDTIWQLFSEWFPTFIDDDEKLGYLALTLEGEYVRILGAMRRPALHRYPDPNGLFVGTSSIIRLIDQIVSDNCEVDLEVYNSIVDRISTEEVSIALDYFRKGMLRKPFKVRFSKGVSEELDIPDRTTFKLWRLSDWIYFSVQTEGHPVQFHRLNLDDAVRNNRVSTNTIFIALRESLAMKRTGPIDNSRVKEMSKKYRDHSLYPQLVFHSMINHFPREWDHEDGEMIWNYYDDMAIHRVNVLPLLLHLYLARFDPVLRGEIKTRKTSKSSPKKERMRSSKGPRKFDWGSDKIRYISVPRNKSGARSSHFVSSHSRNQPISREETIEDYKKRGVPIYRHRGKLCALIYIGSFFKPGSGKLKLDEGRRGAFYSIGSRPRKYSLMAIEWIKSIEKRDSIEIQHATSGGEKRINLGNGNWIFADGYCEENDTIYEFHGDFWHGNPSIYNPDEVNPSTKKTYGELYKRTLEREEAILDLGFNLEKIWESEWESENSGY